MNENLHHHWEPRASWCQQLGTTGPTWEVEGLGFSFLWSWIPLFDLSLNPIWHLAPPPHWRISSFSQQWPQKFQIQSGLFSGFTAGNLSEASEVDHVLFWEQLSLLLLPDSLSWPLNLHSQALKPKATPIPTFTHPSPFTTVSQLWDAEVSPSVGEHFLGAPQTSKIQYLTLNLVLFSSKPVLPLLWRPCLERMASPSASTEAINLGVMLPVPHLS